jgi:hypothetical protein
MLLPLQQAAVGLGAAGGGSQQQSVGAQQQQQQQQQQQDHAVDTTEQHALSTSVQLEVLRRVQGFVSGLAEARIEQQQQVLPQLQQQLKALAQAIQAEERQSASSNGAASSTALANGDGSSIETAADDDSKAAAEAAHEADSLSCINQCINPPSPAELLGFGNLQQLLLLERQQELLWIVEQFGDLGVDELQVMGQELQDYEQIEAAVTQQLEQQQQAASEEQVLLEVTRRFWLLQLQRVLQQELDAIGDDSILLLTAPGWVGLQCLVQQPHQQLAFWAACADAEEVRQAWEADTDHSREQGIRILNSDKLLLAELARRGGEPPGGWGSPLDWSAEQKEAVLGLWQEQKMEEMLQQRAGLTEQQAADLVQVCAQLNASLTELEVRSAAPWHCAHQPLAVLGKQESPLDPWLFAAHSNDSSGAEVFPGVKLSCYHMSLNTEDPQCESALGWHWGPLCTFGLASLLVRAALSHLPGQQPGSCLLEAAEAAAAVPEFQGQLLERLELLKQLAKLVKQVEECSTQHHNHLMQHPWRYQQQAMYQQLKLHQQHQVLQQMLQLALKLAPKAAAQLAVMVNRACQEQTLLCSRLLNSLLLPSLPPARQFAAAAALNTVYGLWAIGQMMEHLQQQTQPQEALHQLLLQHCLSWASSSSNSNSSGDLCSESLWCRSSTAATASLCGLSLPLQPHCMSGMQISATELLLDAVEPKLAALCSAVLAEGLAARRLNPNEMELFEQRREGLQQLLGDREMPAKQWQAVYQQGRGQLEQLVGQLPALARQLQAGAKTLQSWSGAMQQLVQIAEALHSLVLFVKRCVDDTSEAEGFDAGMQRQVSSPQADAADIASVTSDDSSGAAPAAAAAGASQKERLLLLHERLSLLLAVSNALCAAAVREKADDICRLAKSAADQASEVELLAKTSIVPPAAMGSATVHVRHQVNDLMHLTYDMCWGIKNTLHQMQEVGGPAEGVARAAAAAGLGLVAGLGLWQLPPDARGFSKDVSAERAATDSSGGGSDSGDWEADVVEAANKQAQLLELHAVELALEDIRSLIVVLQYMGSLQLTVQGDHSSSSSSGQSRSKLVQLMQQHCSYNSSWQVSVAGPADVEEGSWGLKAFLKRTWHLLLAVKPSVAAALHCSSLPAACRSYEAFERAVLAWPPQPAPADAQQHSSGGGSDSKLCRCGNPGHSYRYPPSHADAILTQLELLSDASFDTADPSEWQGSTTRVVCAEPACVAGELQQLAQQGPPGLLQEEQKMVMHEVLRVLQRDLLRLPEECR